MTRSLRLTMLSFGVVAGLALLTKLVTPIPAISPDSLENSRVQSDRVTQKKADAMVAEILQRPLFTPRRHPPQEKVVRAEPPILQSRLAGVMVQADFREALFSRPGAPPLSVKEGDMIDGWTVKDIETDHVLLTSAFGEQTVEPTNGAPQEIAAQASHPPVGMKHPVGKKGAFMPGLPLFASDLALGRPARR